MPGLQPLVEVLEAVAYPATLQDGRVRDTDGCAQEGATCGRPLWDRPQDLRHIPGPHHGVDDAAPELLGGPGLFVEESNDRGDRLEEEATVLKQLATEMRFEGDGQRIV